MGQAMSNKKTGKCECCPSGGAIFMKDLDGNMNWVWKCQNCHATKPLRPLRAMASPSPGMLRIIDELSSAFGGTKKIEMMGRKAWVALSNEKRSVFNGQSAYGTVCANGRFKLTLVRMCCDDKEITEEWQVKSYFARYNPKACQVCGITNGACEHICQHCDHHQENETCKNGYCEQCCEILCECEE